MEKVDILTPPLFKKTGIVKLVNNARADGDWLGTFNLWILQDKPIPAIIYQVRSKQAQWAPGKLDVSAGGHYSAGEELFDGLREVKEELGKTYKPKDLIYLGRKINVSFDIKKNIRKSVVDISFVLDNSALDTYVLDETEVFAICSLPIDKLIKTFKKSRYQFEAKALTAQGKTIQLAINKNSFPLNWDDYHFKIALLADRFLQGECDLIY
jgi:hypothetical protein